MCLNANRASLDRAKELRKKPGYRVYWKVLNREGLSYSDYYGVSASRRLSSPFYHYVWCGGWNYSSRSDPKLTANEYCRVDEGMHVYTSRKATRENWLSSWRRAVKVRCYNKDCVAFSSNGKDAVYTKVFLTRDEYQDAIKRDTRERRSLCV